LSLANLGDKEWATIDVDLGQPVNDVADTGFSRGFVAFAPHMVEAIRSDTKTIEHAATFEDGVRVQRVLDAARESNASGRAVEMLGRGFGGSSG
jgi:predicted dehydrogenase